MKKIVDWDKVKKLAKKPNKNITISICQNKGGVGKTSITLNLGYILAKYFKVLLIDLDPQANLSFTFDILLKEEPGLKDFISKSDNKAIYNVRKNLDIIPNNMEFESFKRELINKTRMPSYALSKALKSIKTDYDFILIDCPPIMDISFDLASYSSDYILIVMDGHPFSMQGLENILSEVQKVKDEDVTGDLDLNILGIVFNAYKQSKMINTIIDDTKNDYPVFNTKIRENITIPESQLLKKTVFEYNETSNAVHDYIDLFKELMEKINEKRL